MATDRSQLVQILELAVHVWHSGITVGQVKDIERVQKTALFIILGESYINYEVACTLAEIEPLDIRREKLCLKFARKDVRKENTLFTKNKTTVNTRSANIVIEPKCNTKRFSKSSIPYLSKLLNKHSQFSSHL